MENLTSSAQANKVLAALESDGFKPILSNNVPLSLGTHTVTATGVSVLRKITAKDGLKYALIEMQFQTESGEKFYGAINDTALIDEIQSGMKVKVEVIDSKPNAAGKTYKQASYKSVDVPAAKAQVAKK